MFLSNGGDIGPFELLRLIGVCPRPFDTDRFGEGNGALGYLQYVMIGSTYY